MELSRWPLTVKDFIPTGVSLCGLVKNAFHMPICHAAQKQSRFRSHEAKHGYKNFNKTGVQLQHLLSCDRSAHGTNFMEFFLRR
jgi:hypothetical protein